MTAILDSLSNYLSGNIWVALPIAFLAGIVTSLTPCSLQSFPLLISATMEYGENRKLAFKYSVIFCLGMTAAFVALGIVAATLSKSLNLSGGIFLIAIGFLMLVMSMQTLGLINFLPQKCGYKTVSKKGALGVFFTGILGAVFASPCATPVLVAILAVVSVGKSLLLGALMLVLYSAGHSILLIAAGTTVGFSRQLSSSGKFEKFSKTLNIALGLLMLALALYLIYSGFYVYR